MIMSANHLGQIFAAFRIAALGVLGCLASAGSAHGMGQDNSAPVPMVDGSCDEYSRPVAVPDDRLKAWVHDGGQSVFLCIALPEKSFPVGELTVSTPSLEEDIVLHVSAQLGEWAAASPENRPREASSSLWWNNRDWIAAPLRFGGTEQQDGTAEPVFRNDGALEFQFRKSRFGAGQWRIGGTLFSVANPEGPPSPASLDTDGGIVLRVCEPE